MLRINAYLIIIIMTPFSVFVNYALINTQVYQYPSLAVAQETEYFRYFSHLKVYQHSKLSNTSQLNALSIFHDHSTV